MKIKNITIIFTVVILLAIAIYDVYAIAKGGTEASISSLIISWSYQFPAFTFLMGFTMGHLFWRMKSNKDTKGLIDKDV